MGLSHPLFPAAWVLTHWSRLKVAIVVAMQAIARAEQYGIALMEVHLLLLLLKTKCLQLLCYVTNTPNLVV